MATNIRGRTTCHPSAAFKLKCRREKEQLRAALSLQLQKDLKSLLDHGYYSDLSLTCSTKSFKVHSAIIRTRTPKFYEVYCCQDSAENSPDDNTVNITDLSSETLENFIGDIYCNVNLGRDAFPASSYDSCYDEVNSEHYSCSESPHITCSDCKVFHLSDMDYLENSPFVDEETHLSISKDLSDFNANPPSSDQDISSDAVDNLFSSDSLVKTCENGNVCHEPNSLDDISESSTKEIFNEVNVQSCSDSKCSAECDINDIPENTNVTNPLLNSSNDVLEINQEKILLDLESDISSTNFASTNENESILNNSTSKKTISDLQNEQFEQSRLENEKDILNRVDFQQEVQDEFHSKQITQVGENQTGPEAQDAFLKDPDEVQITQDEVQNRQDATKGILPCTCSDDSGKDVTKEILTNTCPDSSLSDEGIKCESDSVAPLCDSSCKTILPPTLSKEEKTSGAWWYSIDFQPNTKVESVSEEEKVENSPGPVPKNKENCNSTAFFVNIGNGNAKVDQKPVRNLRDSVPTLSRIVLKQRLSPPVSPEPDDDVETVYSEFSDAMLFDSAEMKQIDNQSPDEDGEGSAYHKLGYCSKLGQDLLRMFIEEINTDVEIKVEEKKLKAHKCILCTRCNYFAVMLNGSWLESNGNIITLQGFSYNAVHFALLFIYGGVTEIPDNLDLSELISLADMLGLEGLKDVVSFTLRMKYCHFFHKPCAVCTLGVLECLPLASLYGLQELADKSIIWITKHLSRVWVTKSFAFLPEELLQNCFKYALSSVNVDTVIDMVLECDRLMTTLPQVKWSEPILGMASQLMEACVALLSTRFTDVVNSTKFLSLGKGLGWNVNIIDEILTSAIHRFSPVLACLSFIQLNQLIHQQSNVDDNNWNEKFICMLKQVAHHCERLLIHNAGQVVRCKEWKLLSEDVQHKIKEAAIFVDDISKPVAQPPKFSSLNRKFNQKRSDSSKDSPEAKRAANKVPSLQTKSASDLSLNKNGSQPVAAETNNQPELKVVEEQPVKGKKNNCRPKSWPSPNSSTEVNGVVAKARPMSAVLVLETSSKTPENKAKPKGNSATNTKTNKTDKSTANVRIKKSNTQTPKTSSNKPNGLTRTPKPKPKTLSKK